MTVKSHKKLIEVALPLVAIQIGISFICLVALLLLTSCKSANHTALGNNNTSSAPGSATNSLNESKATSQPTILPLTIQADVKSPKTLAIPIAFQLDTSTTALAQVAVKFTNFSSEEIVIPIRFQLDTNFSQLPTANLISGTNFASKEPTPAPTQVKNNWRVQFSFWAMLLVIAIVLVWSIGNLDKFNDVPRRALPAACAIVATIHFYNSSGRADWILIVVLAVGAAPWLSKYIKSISHKGIEFAEQGSVFLAPQPQAPPPGPPPPGQANAPQPQPAGGQPPVLTFNLLSYHEKKILATLWKYQRQLFGENREPRWTFIVLNESPSNMAFSLGCLGLFGKNLAGTAPNGQIMLSNAGFDFCGLNAAQIAGWSDTYDNFSAS